MAATHYGQVTQATLGEEEAQLFLHLRRSIEDAALPLPQIDAAAQNVARGLCPLTDTKKGPAPARVVEFLMRRHGMTEPPPHMITGTFTGPVGAALLKALAGQLGKVNATRVGIGLCADPLRADRRRILMAFFGGTVRIEKVPRVMRLNARVPLTATVTADASDLRWVIADPLRNVTRQPAGAGGGKQKVAASLRCLLKGVYRVQLMGHGKLGPQVLAGFPVYCAIAAPSQVALTQRGSVAATSIPELETEAMRLLQTLRREAGRAELVPDFLLAKMAKGHSGDMLQRDYVGHRSPTGSGPADRAKRVGLSYQVLRENVARAYSLHDAFEQLKESPSHLQNMLADDITHVGVGISLKKKGEVVLLYLTQNFSRPAKPHQRAPEEPQPWQK